MSIVILEKSTNLLADPPCRNAKIWVSNNGEAYILMVLGLPLEGNLQTVLAANEAAYFSEAQAAGILPTETETEIAGAVLWYIANPGTKAAVFDKTIAQENTDITALIAASFPSLGAGFRAAWLQLLMSSLLDTRVNAHDRNLV